MTHSILPELEKSVIGAILIRRDTLELLPTLETQDFVSGAGRICWEAIRNLEAAGKAIDAMTIADEAAKRRNLLEDYAPSGEQKLIEVLAYLGECAFTVPTVDNAIEYAHRLKDHTLRRRVMEALAEVIQHGQRGQETGADLLSMALAGLSVLDADQPEQARSIGEVIKERMRQLEEIAKERALGTRTLSGYPTGVRSLDEKIGGFQPGIVSLVAARPGMGKSSFGLATADACTSAGYGAHVFSLEDTAQAYADRSMARTSGVSAESIRNCAISQRDMESMRSELPKIQKRTQWLFDDRSGISAQEIVRSVRRHKKQNNTKLVIVDYIQLVSKPDRRSTNHESISENITTFADAAKQDGIAYVVMSQLNRELEKRTDKRPQLSDLRESGSLEERSKCVIGLYRGIEYSKKPKKGIDYQHQEPTQEEFEKQIQLLVLKNSNGRTGRVYATWHGPTTRVD